MAATASARRPTALRCRVVEKTGDLAQLVVVGITAAGAALVENLPGGDQRHLGQRHGALVRVFLEETQEPFGEIESSIGLHQVGQHASDRIACLDGDVEGGYR